MRARSICGAAASWPGRRRVRCRAWCLKSSATTFTPLGSRRGRSDADAPHLHTRPAHADRAGHAGLRADARDLAALAADRDDERLPGRRRYDRLARGAREPGVLCVVRRLGALSAPARVFLEGRRYLPCVEKTLVLPSLVNDTTS